MVPMFFEDTRDTKYSARASNVGHVIRLFLDEETIPSSGRIIEKGVALINELIIGDTVIEKRQYQGLAPSYQNLRMFGIAKPSIILFKEKFDTGGIDDALVFIKDRLIKWNKTPAEVLKEKKIAKIVAEFFEILSDDIDKNARERQLVNPHIKRELGNLLQA